MSSSDDPELAALRERVYGPNADLEGDPEAIRRLRELEDARRPPVPVAVDDSEPPPPDPVAAPAPPPPPEVPSLSERLLARVARLRRSTVLIVLGAVAFVTVIVTLLVLVQRVQTDPLQTGATQVARLGVDPEWRVPDLFRGGSNGGVQAQGFELFEGLRPVVTQGSFFGADTDSSCLAVFVDADIDDPEAGSFSGPLLGGCAIAGFPAVAQFASDLEGFPDELDAAYPDCGIQFVYDSANNEVVVFVSQ